MEIVIGAGLVLGVFALAVLVAAAGSPQAPSAHNRGPSFYQVGGVVAGAVALHHFHENHEHSEYVRQDIERAQHLAGLEAPFGSFEYYQAEAAHLHHRW